MKIKREDLINILEVSRMAVAGSDHLEQLGHFIFGGDNLITFNNRLLIYYPFESDFQCSVTSDLFFKQMQKFKTEEVEMNLVENRLEVEGTREKAKIAVMLQKDKEIFDIINSIREESLATEYVPVPEEFIRAIDFCSYSASKNAADGTLCCVCINGNTVLSCDNFRATKYEMDKSMTDNRDILLDARVANEIKRFKMTEFGIGENWLHFKNKGGVILSARQIFGDYMDISKAFEIDGKRMQLPEKTVEALDFVSVPLAGEQQLERLADIVVDSGYITARVNKDKASVEKAIPLEIERYKSLSFTFRINVDFFRSVLEHTPRMIFDLKTGRAKFKSSNFEHVIRLMPDVNTPETAAKAVEDQQASEPQDDDIPF